MQNELIFRKALASTNVRAVREVADIFHRMGQADKAVRLREHARAMSNVGFGGTTVTVGDVQVKLNALGTQPPLSTDGVAGPKTTAAVVAFQSANGLVPDGKVGPLTLAALGFAGAQVMVPGLPTGSGGGSSVPVKGGISLPAFPGVLRLSQADRVALVKAAQEIGINPDWLAAVMQFESGIDPSKENLAGSGATGLIQFMPDTASAMGTSTAALKQMTFQQQLPYVIRYFAPHKGKLQSLEDTYLAVFYPAFIGVPNDQVLASSGNPIYDQNAGFDRTGKGYVTKEDITSTIRGVLASATSRITVTTAVAVGGGLVAILMIAGGIAWWVLRKRIGA